MIVFILGRTGSGKSTTARFLIEIAQNMGWSVKAFNDYPFLRKMYETDTLQRFRPTDHDGFEVLDLSVYETAIQLLAQQVQVSYSVNNRTLFTVEFTSNNYCSSLQFFDKALLSNAHFLCLNADLLTCMERISKRVLRRTTEDDYHVIENVLLSHYPSPYMPLRIGKEKAKFIHNMASIGDLKFSINSIILDLFEHEGQSPLFTSDHHLFAFV